MSSRHKIWRRRLYLALFLILAIAMMLFWQMQPLRCLFKAATGYPCPGCGSLRVLHALFNGDWIRAITLNPLALVVYLILGGYVLSQAYDEWRGTKYASIFGRALPWWAYILLGVLVVTNWYYLIQVDR